MNGSQEVNFMVEMSFCGTRYHGFQKQKNGIATIQQTVEEGIFRLLGERAEINGCSRTDAGVHANSFIFSVSLKSPINERGLIFGLNGVLPKDISILSCRRVGGDFHARFDCSGKEYVYKIHNSEIRNPFYENRIFRSWYPIDEKKLDLAAKDFIGRHDFKAFCSSDTDKEETVRTVFSFDVSRSGDIVEFTVSGDGFLYNMVRIMVGTLLFINDGKLSRDSIPKIIKSKDRTRAGKTVPAHGLYLNRVFYD